MNRNYILKPFLLTLLLILAGTLWSQVEVLPSPIPYFSALIVEDIDISMEWYKKHLGMTVHSQNENEQIGYKQANLQRGDLAIELIELRDALTLEKLVKDYHSKIRQIGFFKIGFKIVEFDGWIKHLRAAKVRFNGSIVEDPVTKKRMTIILDPDGNRIQLFEQ